jgi:hypothetical protein
LCKSRFYCRNFDFDPSTWTKFYPETIPGDPARGRRFMPKLTNELIASIVAEGIERTVFDSATPGFGFRLTAKKKGIWLARARAGNVRSKISLGTYPEKSLSAARAEAHAALRDIRDGKDPRAEKAARRMAAQAGKITVAELADRWLAEYVRIKLKPRTIADYERITDDRIKPRLGALPVAAVGKSDVISFHASMANTPRRANYVVATFLATVTFSQPRAICSTCSNRKMSCRNGSVGRRSYCGHKVFTVLGPRRAAIKPPSSKPFETPCAPPSRSGLPPIATVKAS